MKFKIYSQIFEKFPETLAGFVIAKNVNNIGILEELQNQIRQQEKEIKALYNTETLSQNPNLVDIYNLISLKYMVPVGGEDIDKIN